MTLQTPVSFCPVSTLFTVGINAFIGFVRKELRSKRASLPWSWERAFVFCSLFLISWMLALGLSSTHPSKHAVAETHGMRWLLKELGPWFSAFCGSSKDVLAVQLCAAKPAGSGCKPAWELQVWSCFCWLPQVIYAIIFGGGVVANSWSRWMGGRRRAVILQTGSCLLPGCILTAWEACVKAQFLSLGTLAGQGPLDHQRTFAAHLSVVMLLFRQCKSPSSPV